MEQLNQMRISKYIYVLFCSSVSLLFIILWFYLFHLGVEFYSQTENINIIINSKIQTIVTICLFVHVLLFFCGIALYSVIKDKDLEYKTERLITRFYYLLFIFNLVVSIVYYIKDYLFFKM